MTVQCDICLAAAIVMLIWAWLRLTENNIGTGTQPHVSFCPVSQSVPSFLASRANCVHLTFSLGTHRGILDRWVPVVFCWMHRADDTASSPPVQEVQGTPCLIGTLRRWKLKPSQCFGILECCECEMDRACCASETILPVACGLSRWPRVAHRCVSVLCHKPL